MRRDARGPCGGKAGGVIAGGSEVVAEGLALLREGRAEEFVEAFGVDVEFSESGSEVEAQDGGEDRSEEHTSELQSQ